HILSMLVYSSDRGEALSVMAEQHLTQRIANVSHLISVSPPGWRNRIVAALNEPLFSITLSSETMFTPGAPDSEKAFTIQKYMENALKKDSVRRIFTELSSGTSGVQSLIRFTPLKIPHQSLRISVELNDGQWLNFLGTFPKGRPFWSGASLLSVLSMAVAAILLSVWVVRRLTMPLGKFARAAERLGKDMTAPALPIDGPTELRQASRAFNEMQERLRRFIENRTRMLAAISHDLRTPITLLRLRSELVDDEDLQAQIMSTLDEMETMIASTLAFAREDAVMEERRKVDISALLDSICDDLCQAGLPIEADLPHRVAYECRPVSMKRAFTNLIDNAVKYGGKAYVAMTAADGVVKIDIEDRGPGIPEEEMEHVFTPFYRIDPSRNPKTGGIGLGMSVAQTIIHAHGGRISLSRAGKGGLRVHIELPR
ncbi:MAG TPA: HAMP domain-containing protein, partial [Rhodospirillales bacterium]|nr:HAMP domain-containing protein [Rhodospirillales bacterium]